MAQKDFLNARIEDAALKAERMGIAVYVDFYEPQLQHIIEREIGRYPSCDCEFFGGHEYCERKMLAVFPKGDAPSYDDYPIDCIHIKTKNMDISHPDVLGSLLGLGLQREKTGDINIVGDSVQLFVEAPLGEFVENNLQKISRYEVEAKRVSASDVISVEPSFTPVSIIIPSMRIDAVIHSVYKLSRSEASNFVKSEKVYVNHVVCAKPGAVVKAGDVVSVRSKGRFIVDEITGNTKKGNIKLAVRKFV